MTGSLSLVGTGFGIASQMTPEALASVDQADRVLHILSDPATAAWLERLRPDARTLTDLYGEGKNRGLTYGEMTEAILAPAREGDDVCVVFYGHPGVLVSPSHAARRAADAEGLAARMLPGLSAESLLYADLGVDPVGRGCHSYEATDFLLRPRPVETTSALILWQIGSVGVTGYRNAVLWSREGLGVLADALLEHYPPEHDVVVYEASPFPIADSLILSVRLDRLRDAEVSVVSTLYVPPLAPAPVDDRRHLLLRERLGERACPVVPFDGSGAILPPAPRSTGAIGALDVVGIGYGLAGHLTPEARHALEAADRVFYLVSDPLQGAWLQSLVPGAESLHGLYGESEAAADFHGAMKDQVLADLSTGRRVCLAVTGHPSIMVPPAIEAVAEARRAGHPARLVPGVSIEDCMVAEVGFDPGVTGRMLYDATDFTLRPRRLDPTACLVLLQAGTLGEHRFRQDTTADPGAVDLLRETLLEHYPPTHDVVIYETAPAPFGATRIEHTSLRNLSADRLSVVSTLYLPPREAASRDTAMARKLGLT